MSLLEKIALENPKTSVVTAAVRTLTDPMQIQQFYEEYVAYLQEHGASQEVRQNPKNVADRNLGWVIFDFNNYTRDIWMKALPSIHHAIFGRDVTVTPDQAQVAGEIAAYVAPELAKEYIERRHELDPKI